MCRGRPVGVRCLMVVLTTVVILSATSCGGQGGEGAAPGAQLVVKAENAAVGTSIEGEVWKLTLLDAPEQMKMIGGEVVGDAAGVGKYVRLQSGQSFSDDDITADGVYMMAPIEITNVSDEAQYVSQSVLKVMDADGQSYDAGGRIEHKVYVWITERWMNEDNELIPGVMDPGQTRQGPTIFDVPEDATGLVLTIEGIEDTIDLGF